MSKQQRDHGTQSWFAEREAARAAGGAAADGTTPELHQQDSEQQDAANPQEPPGQNVGNRGIGQYSGQGVPARIKK